MVVEPDRADASRLLPCLSQALALADAATAVLQTYVIDRRYAGLADKTIACAVNRLLVEGALFCVE